MVSDQSKVVPRILRRKQVEERTGFCRSMIYAKINPKSPKYDPTFPAPFNLGNSSAVGWLESSVNAWIETQAQRGRRPA